MSGSREPPSPYLHIPEAESWRRKVKTHTHTHTLGSTQTISFIAFYISLIQDMVNSRWHHLTRKMTQCTSSLLLQVRPTCVQQRRAPTSWRWNVSLSGASSAVLISAPSHTFSLDFKFLIFLLQFDCFTIYFKSKGHALILLRSFWVWDLSHTVHTCFQPNREREGFNLTAQEGWASVHFSILLFPITCSSLANEHPLGQMGPWEEELFLNWRPQRNSPFLILLYAWPPLPSWVGKTIGTKQ